jgi:nucleotide-binding universal stress UspA family protein
MLAVRTILHPTDFSDRSQAAFGLACALARDYGARLVVLHVVTVPTVIYGEGLLPTDPDELHAAAREELERLVVSFPGLRVEKRLGAGDAAEEILSIACAEHADLIVMGTHGRTGLERLLMGSVAEQVVRQAACPVVTVKAPFRGAAPAGTDREEAGECRTPRHPRTFHPFSEGEMPCEYTKS